MPKRKHHYVYALMDPRTLRPFYIGKGTGDRMVKHFSSIPTAIKGAKTSDKFRRIEEIKSEGYIPTINIVKYYNDELEALDAEAKMIKEIGLENLTNQLKRGGRTSKYNPENAVTVPTRKPTLKQEAYCQASVDPDCPNRTEAYRRAYPGTNMSNASINRTVFDLDKNPIIISRIEELRAELNVFVGATLDECVTGFRSAAVIASDTSNAQGITGAYKEIGSISGLYPKDAAQQVNVQVNTVIEAPPTRTELARRLVHIIQDGVLDGSP